MESPETGEPAAAPLRTASTAQALLASPEISLLQWPDTDTQTQQEAVAASAGDVTLVVWSQHAPDGNRNIRGARIRKSDGALLDATPLCIACGPGSEYEPAVASNGTDFLVSWDDIPSFFPRMMSVRVRGSDGAVLGPARVLRDAPLVNYRSSIASDGSNYLVVWKGYDERLCGGRFCGYDAHILGARVSSVDGSSSFISLPNADTRPEPVDQPQVTYGGGNYLVTWSGYPSQSGNTGNTDLYTLRVRASDGMALDSAPRILASGGGRKPMAASDGSRFLVVWTTAGGEIRAGRLGQDGTVLDPGGFLVSAGNAMPHTNVLFDGTDYRVVWEPGQGLVRPLKGVRVTRDGQVVSGSESLFVEQRYWETSSTSYRPALAILGPGRFLLGYTKSTPYLFGVKVRVVEDMPLGTACTQDAQCQSGSCVDGVCCNSACGGGAANDCQACSVAAGGSVDGTCGAVRAEAAVVCRPSAVACDVAETCDGTSLSCPADEPPASQPDLSGDKCEDTPCDVASYLAALGPESLEQPFGQSLQAKAVAACGSFQAGNTQATQGQLKALRNEVRAQQGKKLSASVADTLLASLTGLLGF
jgi:hypothetical protein